MHECAHTHAHTEFTLSPLFGQETAQCGEAPFSIFVVLSTWLLREEGQRAGMGDGGGTGRRHRLEEELLSNAMKGVVAVQQSGGLG